MVAAVNRQGYWSGEEQCLHKAGHLFGAAHGERHQGMIWGLSQFVSSFHDITQGEGDGPPSSASPIGDDLAGSSTTGAA